jgi:hypothetical protein
MRSQRVSQSPYELHMLEAVRRTPRQKYTRYSFLLRNRKPRDIKHVQARELKKCYQSVPTSSPCSGHTCQHIVVVRSLGRHHHDRVYRMPNCARTSLLLVLEARLTFVHTSRVITVEVTVTNIITGTRDAE